jgi:hypothetical protein
MKKNNTLLSLIVLMAIFLLFGCKRNDVIQNPTTPGVTTPVDDFIQVKASVSGIVLDETNKPIADAVVTSGAATTITNTNGLFSFNDISLSKENGSVTVVKAGYFKGVRSFKTIANKNNTVRIQLMPKALSGSVNAATGGLIGANGNATINFPSNAFITSTGAAYTGAVKVYSRWIDPTAANLAAIIPGDLRGVGTNGAESILTTYGMLGAELEDANGNALKIATGKKATISFPLPANLTASAPATIVLWHFDEATARWKENGKATKAGSTYIAEVDKFSFWNCDVPNTFINLDYTLINSVNNTPLVNTSTRLKRLSNGTYSYAITNNTGFVSGAVPKNEALVLEVVSNTCNTIIYTKNIGPFTSNTSLGNISVNLPANEYINFSGVALNCTNAPVTNGYVSFYGAGGNNAFVNTSATGSFNFSILNCGGGNMAYECQATDYTTTQQSALLTGTVTNGTVSLGNIFACGSAAGTNVYVAGYRQDSLASVWKNGVVTNLTNGAYLAEANSIYIYDNDVYVAGYERNADGKTVAKLWKNGIATNLTNGTYIAAARSVYVSGNNVYVAGFGGSTSKSATVWKNGIATDLTDGACQAAANSVYLSGNDVYVAGYESKCSGNARATVWKNGIVTHFTNGISSSSLAKSVCVSGNDVYVAGYDRRLGSNDVATVWKNGIAINLTDGTYDANANSIYISGNDVYVTGEEKNANGTYVAKLWKNGIATNLTNGTYKATARSVYVSDNDVYVAGYEYDDNNIVAKLWKNGIAINLGNGGFANCVFVK